MFTGIVEETGTVTLLDRLPAGARLELSAARVLEGTAVGDSVAVNGCCLTVTRLAPSGLAFDLLEETLRRTNLGTLTPGASVNLERALPATGRLGGHFVQGHIDCASEILALDRHGDDHRLEIALPPDFARYVAIKGSVAIDGISLTVAEILPASFVLWIIPRTMEVTTLRHARPGILVNVELDLLAKYTERLLAARNP